jgi:hypothetical protein
MERTDRQAYLRGVGDELGPLGARLGDSVLLQARRHQGNQLGVGQGPQVLPCRGIGTVVLCTLMHQSHSGPSTLSFI